MPDLPSTMCGTVLTGHGGFECLEYRTDLTRPDPASDEVLVAVEACGVNNTDVNTRVGWYAKSVAGATDDASVGAGVDGSWGGGLAFPRIQGADPSGHIVAVGSDVDAARVGERVMIDPWIRHPSGDRGLAGYLGSERDGGFAEFVAVPAVNAHTIVTPLSAVELASFPCSYSTAEHMLQRAGVIEGQWVAITGASGGVGSALIQLARRRGASTIAIASGGKLDALHSLGADAMVDRNTDDLASAVTDAAGGPIDVLADVVGGPGFPELFEQIRRGGHYVTSGAIAGPIVDLDLRTLYLHDLTMHGATVFEPQVFADLVGYVERGEIRPVVAGVWGLDDIPAAQEAFLRKEHVGSMVVEVA